MRTYISSKPYKQWCKARGIDFVAYMQGFPLVAERLNMPKFYKPIIKLTLREKIKNFFRY